MKTAIFILLLALSPASAATKYLRQGATGSGSGNDWTNAYATMSQLESGLSRGDTAYVANGTYAGNAFDNAASGSTTITIRKATIADHGTNTGWSNEFGDGVAEFTSTIRFRSSWWVFDGVTGGGPPNWTTGFGFKISVTGQSSGPGVWVDAAGDHVTLRHIEIQGNGGDGDGPAAPNDGVTFYPGANNGTVSYAYIHDMGRTIMMCSASDVLFEYVYTGEFESTSGEHSEIISFNAGKNYPVTGGVVRYNIFTWFEGTGGVIYHGSGLQLYGNVFDNKNPGFGGANGMTGGWSWGRYQNVKIYNNTFINSPLAIGGQGNTSGNMVRNNLFYKTKVDPLGGTFDYNHYIDMRSPPPAEAHRSSGTGNPFANSVGYQLAVNTPGGTNLGVPSNKDSNDATRTTWTRGALEFSDGQPPGPPAPPQRLCLFTPGSAPTLNSIAVTPGTPSINTGATQQFTATGSYSDGNTQNLTSQVTWTSSNATVATINDSGLATGASAGSTTIRGQQSGVIGSTTLTVQTAPLAITTSSLPNGTLNSPYSATLTANGGSPSYTWSLASDSLPSGLTLNPTTGAISGTPSATGSFSFTAQVSDSSTPPLTTTKSLSITVSAAPSTLTIWPTSTVPGVVDGGPDKAVQLGVKFRSDVAGTIRGIRFYKSAGNTGTHVASLWSSTGTRLATATFTNETASGWQEVSFATPVSIIANTTYVASYHTTTGHYSINTNYFTAGVDNPPLHALASAGSGRNGVYRYGTTSAFPNQTFKAANYWVDVVFQPQSSQAAAAPSQKAAVPSP